MDILFVREPVTKRTLEQLAKAWHGDCVKGVADIVLGSVALGGEWHKDALKKLLEQGSNADNVWGFILYPDKQGSRAIEYDSMVNIKPRFNNHDRTINDPEVVRAVHVLASLAVPFLHL